MKVKRNVFYTFQSMLGECTVQTCHHSGSINPGKNKNSFKMRVAS